MKGKGTWKRWLCAVLVAALICTLPGTEFAATEDKVEWTYENSILVQVEVDESRTFSPEDFPEIGCKKVFVMGKSQVEQRVKYELILRLDISNNADLEKTIEKIQRIPMVVNVLRNNKYTPVKSFLELDRTCIYLAVGEEADVAIKRLDGHGSPYGASKGICFIPDSTYFNLDLLQKNSFSNFGISRFWPDTGGGGEYILAPGFRPDDLEGKKSESGIYYGLAGENNEHLMNTVALMAAASEILEVSVVRYLLIGAISPSSYWEMEDETIASVRVPDKSNNKMATIQGLKPGITKLFANRDYGAEDCCTVIIYEPGSKNNPGDINHDGILGTYDALQALEYSVGLISLDETDKAAADLNQDNVVDVKDALLMLKIVSGTL